MRKLMVLVLLSLSGCGRASTSVECEESVNCNLESNGLCVEYGPTGNKWCQYPDTTCASGMRWSDFDTGDGLSGICVGAEPDGGPDDADACVPTTCVAEGANCDSIDDGCGTTIPCGVCVLPETCGGGGSLNVCGCTSEADGEFCTRLGKDCDIVSANDNCGISRSVNCGSCPSPLTCAGGENTNVCGCTTATETADASTNDVGFDTSIAVDGLQGIHIAYRDTTAGDLKYVYRPVGGAWTTPVLIASENNVGNYASLAIGTDQAAHVAYQDVTNHDLVYAYRPVGGIWGTPLPLETAGFSGAHISMALDGENGIHIAYRHESDHHLKYITKPAGGLWSAPATIDASDGQYASLVVDGSGAVHVAYYNASSLKYLNRPFGGSWGSPVTIDSGGDVGQYASLGVDGDGGLHVAYQDVTNSNVKYAYRPSGGSWGTPQTIDAAADVGKDTSLAIDTLGDVHVVYYDATGMNLQYLHRPAGGAWDSPIIIDSPNDVGLHASIAAGVAVHVAYLNYSTRDLKYAMICP